MYPVAACRGHLALPAEEWTPLELSSLLGAWDALAGLVFQNSNGTGAATGTDPTGYVTDRSGNGHHLTQGTAGNRPSLTTINGRGGLAFGGSHWLVCNALAALLDDEAPFTFSAVVKPTNFAASRSYLGLGSSSTITPVHTLQSRTTAVFRHNRTSDGGTNLSHESGAIVAATPYLVIATFDGTTGTLYVNGGAGASGSLAVGAITVDRFTIGALTRPTVIQHFLGDLGGITLQGAVAPDWERALLWAYRRAEFTL